MGSQGDSYELGEAVRAVRSVASDPSGVLIVEADPDMQWRLARMLTVQGHRVVGTSSGDGAMALISQWPVDLVLIAENLPGKSGIEVAQQLQADHPEIPVVLMTRGDCAKVESAAKLSGVVACLTKPFRVETLTALLQSLAMAPLAEPAE